MIVAIIVLVLACPRFVFADPGDEEALRVQRYHDQLQQVGIGPTTLIWVLLRDGENLKGTIYYLNDGELGLRDEFGHRHHVLLKGIVEFTARNQETGMKAASTNWLYRTARQWWRRVSGTNLNPWIPQQA